MMMSYRICVTLLLCAFLLLTMVQYTAAEEGAFAPRPTNWTGPVSGLSLLFNMQRGLANIIQMSTIGDLIDEYNLHTFDDITSDEFIGKWNEWMLYAIGYVVCIAIGVLLAIILPITGCGICSSRVCKCCGKCCKSSCCCCSKTGKMRVKGDRWKCKRIGFSITMGVLITFLLASVICSFIAVTHLKEEIGESGLLETVLQGFYYIDGYLASSSEQIDESLIHQVTITAEAFRQTMYESPKLITDDLGKESNVLPNLTHFQDFVGSLPVLNLGLISMSSAGVSLQTGAQDLELELNPCRARLGALLNMNNCPVPECSDALAQLPDLKIGTDYNGLVDLAPLVGAIGALPPSIETDVDTGADQYWMITTTVGNELNATTGSVVTSINDFEVELHSAMIDMQEFLSQVNLTELENMIAGFKPHFEEYGGYAYWGFIGVTAFCTVIVLCYLMGLVLGLALPSPSIYSSKCSCTSKQGSSFLLAGASLTFILSWLLMAILIVVFASGGIIQNNICRHLLVYDSAMDKLEGLVMNTMAEQGSNYSISLKEAGLSCQQNMSLYVAANVEQNGIDISDVVDLEQYGIYDLIDQIRNITIEVIPPGSSIDFLPPTVITDLTPVGTAIDATNFSTYDVELSKDITLIHLLEYADKLELAADAVGSSNPPIADDLRIEATSLRTLHDTGKYNDVALAHDDLGQAYSGVKSILGIFDLSSGLVQLSTAQNTLNSDGNSIVKTSLNKLGDGLEVKMETFSTSVEESVRNEIGTCRDLYDAGTTVVDAGCIYFLDAYNAVWFCLGWFMLFGVLAVAFANELAYVFSAFGPSSKVVPEMLNKDGNFSMPPSPPPPYDEESFALTRKTSIVTPPVPIAFIPPDAIKSNNTFQPVAKKTRIAPYDDEDAYLISGEGEHYV